MKMFLSALMFLLFTCPCFAKAYYASRTEMILEADAIAIVNITKVENVEKQITPMIYRQKVSATVEQSLKGDIKGTIEIYGMENFTCAQCNYKVGRFIVFLSKRNSF